MQQQQQPRQQNANKSNRKEERQREREWERAKRNKRNVMNFDAGKLSGKWSSFSVSLFFAPSFLFFFSSLSPSFFLSCLVVVVLYLLLLLFLCASNANSPFFPQLEIKDKLQWGRWLLLLILRRHWHNANSNY